MRIYFQIALAAVLGVGVSLGRTEPAEEKKSTELLNVSYDPTRELWRDLNADFAPRFEKDQGRPLSIRQSHGGSTSQARAVADGLQADVVSLALWSDIDRLRQKGLVAEGWEKRLPNQSRPYYSTIVFVVRKGNPRGIKDWSDLVKGDVQVVTPSPRTSGNGKLSFLAAWGAVLHKGGSEKDAREFVAQLYRRSPIQDAGARDATVTFAAKKVGDVHLTWENEAYLETREFPDLEIVYPPASIRAEPVVAWVDANVQRHQTRQAAEAYLRFLYTEPAQEILARHHYRPSNAEVLKRHADALPKIELFPISVVAKDWADAEQKFFARGGVFDGIARTAAK